MKRNNKKGFTIVELVVVIVVIAVLAAVLIPTFTSLIAKANLSADQMTVKNMNTALTADEITDGKPENTTKVKEVLKAAGFNTKTLTPVSDGYRFFWDSNKNSVVLVNTSTNKATYPADAEYTKGDARYIPLDNIPEAAVTMITGDSLKVRPTKWTGSGDAKDELGFDVTMETGVMYSCLDDKDTIASSDYANYYADFRITFSKKLTYTGTGDNPTANGKVGFMLLGKYDSKSIGGTYGTYNWVPLTVTGSTGTVNADGTQTVYAMKDLMRMKFGYNEVVSQVGTFECGIKAVYDDSYNAKSFTNYDNQTMDDADAEFLDGLTVTVELILREEVDNTGYTGEEIIVNTYSYTYHVVNNQIQ